MTRGNTFAFGIVKVPANVSKQNHAGNRSTATSYGQKLLKKKCGRKVEGHGHRSIGAVRV